MARLHSTKVLLDQTPTFLQLVRSTLATNTRSNCFDMNLTLPVKMLGSALGTSLYTARLWSLTIIIRANHLRYPHTIINLFALRFSCSGSAKKVKMGPNWLPLTLENGTWFKLNYKRLIEKSDLKSSKITLLTCVICTCKRMPLPVYTCQPEMTSCLLAPAHNA